MNGQSRILLRMCVCVGIRQAQQAGKYTKDMVAHLETRFKAHTNSHIFQPKLNILYVPMWNAIIKYRMIGRLGVSVFSFSIFCSLSLSLTLVPALHMYIDLHVS